MKTVIIIAILMFRMNVTAQYDAVSFEKVIKTDSIGKAQLFSTINDWFATNYNSANNVLQMVDKDAGILIGKGSMDFKSKIGNSYNGRMDYTIKVYIKDNRYKVVLSNFNHTGLGISLGLISNEEIYATKGMYKKWNNKAWIEMKSSSEQYSNDIFNSLENKTKDSYALDGGDDW